MWCRVSGTLRLYPPEQRVWWKQIRFRIQILRVICSMGSETSLPNKSAGKETNGCGNNICGTKTWFRTPLPTTKNINCFFFHLWINFPWHAQKVLANHRAICQWIHCTIGINYGTRGKKVTGAFAPSLHVSCAPTSYTHHTDTRSTEAAIARLSPVCISVRD